MYSRGTLTNILMEYKIYKIFPRVNDFMLNIIRKHNSINIQQGLIGCFTIQSTLLISGRKLSLLQIYSNSHLRQLYTMASPLIIMISSCIARGIVSQA